MSQKGQSNQFPKLFTLKETATIFQVSRQTVKNWIDAGKFKVMRIGERGDFRITYEELARFVKENQK